LQAATFPATGDRLKNQQLKLLKTPLPLGLGGRMDALACYALYISARRVTRREIFEKLPFIDYMVNKAGSQNMMREGD